MPDVGRSASGKTHTQAVLFSKEAGWTAASGKKWLKDHKMGGRPYYTDGHEETDKYHRWRQFDPDGDKFRYRNKTIERREGKPSVVLVLGFKKSLECDMNDKMLEAIRARRTKQTEFGYGIRLASDYVRTLQECVGLDVCNRFASKGRSSFDDLMQKAARTLVYSNPDMVVEKKQMVSGAKLRGLDLPKNTLMVFRHVLTTNRKDRDGDVLHSEGAEVDPNMLLLWQHVSTLPIGKLIKVSSQNRKRLVVTSAIVDMNELSHDAAVMVDNGMGRFSHGFQAVEFEPIKNKEDEVTGFDVKRFEIMEESLVSVPSNVDAETEDVLLSLVEGGKLTSPLMKQVGQGLRERRNVAVPGVELKYRESEGDKVRELSCGSFADLKAAADAGLIGETKDEDEPSDGEGTGAGASEKADGEAEGKEVEAEGAGDAEVIPEDMEEAKGNIEIDEAIISAKDGSEDMGPVLGEASFTVKVRREGITAREAMADFLATATPWERVRMGRAMWALADEEERKRVVKQYQDIVGLKK